MSKSLLKQAEQNVINRAKAYDDVLKFLDALANFGNRACHEYIGKKQFFEGLGLMRIAVYTEQSQALRECFYLSGVGGKEAEEYSKELFKRVFNQDYGVMQFLDKWGQTPSWYKTEDKETFLKECKDAIE